jgi:hypothetical protein
MKLTGISPERLVSAVGVGGHSQGVGGVESTSGPDGVTNNVV